MPGNELDVAAVDKAIKDAKKIIETLAKSTLQSYWQLGELVRNLDVDYGNSTLKEFAKRLATDTGKEYSETTLYRMRQFFERTPIDRLAEMMKAGIRWSHVVSTLGADSTIVEEVTDKVIAGELPPQKLADTVKTAVDGDGVPGGLNEVAEEQTTESTEDSLGDPRKLLKTITKTIGIISGVTESLGDVILIADKYENMGKEDKAKFKKPMGELYETMRQLSDAGGPAYESLEKVLDTAK